MEAVGTPCKKSNGPKICKQLNVSADYILFGFKQKSASLVDLANTLTIEELETTIRYLRSLIEMKKMEI